MPPTCNIEPIRADTADGNYLKEVAADWYLYIRLDLGVKGGFEMSASLFINPFDFVYRHGLTCCAPW